MSKSKGDRVSTSLRMPRSLHNRLLELAGDVPLNVWINRKLNKAIEADAKTFGSPAAEQPKETPGIYFDNQEGDYL